MACAILARMLIKCCETKCLNIHYVDQVLLDNGKVHDTLDMWDWMEAGCAPSIISYNVLILEINKEIPTASCVIIEQR
jgi:hypothetical protein